MINFKYLAEILQGIFVFSRLVIRIKALNTQYFMPESSGFATAFIFFIKISKKIKKTLDFYVN